MRVKQMIALVVATWFAVSANAGPRVATWETGNGARVLFVENHDLPMLDVAVDFAAGFGYDTADLAGRASLVCGMLKLGAGGIAEDVLAKKIADIGAQLGPRFDQDRAGIVLRTLSDAQYRNVALDVMTTVITRPDFPETVVAREKARAIAGIREAATLPGPVSRKAFLAAVYGNHPYGVPGTGTEESVSQLTRDDLVIFHQSRYTAQNAVVSIMGDVSRHDAEAIANALTSGLPTRGSAADIPPVTPLSEPAEREISFPSSQAHVLMGEPGMTRLDADYFPLYVGNYVLGGGGFDSRLIEEERQKRGLAYSAYSYFLPLSEPGPFEIGLQTRKTEVPTALKVARDTVARFVAEGPTDAELAQAKSHLVDGFPLRIDTNKKILDYLSTIGFYRLPLTYIDDFPGHVEQVTRTQIVDAFQRRVHPSRMATVVVGGPAGP